MVSDSSLQQLKDALEEKNILSFAQAAEELGESVNNVKSLFQEKHEEFNGEALFYLSGMCNDAFKVSILNKTSKDAAVNEYSSIFSCHIWGFQTKDYNKEMDNFTFSDTPLSLGIRSNEVPKTKTVKSSPPVAAPKKTEIDVFKNTGKKKENKLKDMLSQKTTVKKEPSSEPKKEAKPAAKPKTSKKTDFFANARAKGKAEQKVKEEPKEPKEEAESISDCDDPMENRQTPPKAAKRASKVFETKSKPTKRTRIVMSDDSEEENDKADEMEVDEEPARESPKKKSPKKLKVAKNRRRVALESDSESDDGNNMDNTGGRLLFGGSDDEENLEDSVKNVSLMSEDEVAKSDSDEEKENKKQAKKKKEKKEIKEETPVTKFGTAKVKPGKVMKKVQKKRTYVDDEGNMVTEKYYVEVEVDPSEIEEEAKAKPAPQKIQSAPKPAAKKTVAKPKHQPSISSFFMKKK
ncbi:Oidioi.mRNA.OKI2018_I69.XSR.g13553.t2.cds [Oikopleura dioica]|uniref:Oidioi.mRNA.OKI2018_I69.XSR.g13553.t2.cds n=1 Tax=Oikopleura dioica TaxID=34765 RepID=A0ABN7SDB9_OIKDI|nr:Oidioi.mRNA.OKI2018_I69.XSR.g13553.t2.cds [Oikopleura dioica]